MFCPICNRSCQGAPCVFHNGQCKLADFVDKFIAETPIDDPQKEYLAEPHKQRGRPKKHNKG